LLEVRVSVKSCNLIGCEDIVSEGLDHISKRLEVGVARKKRFTA
jgi:hypothetical protein